LFNLDPVNMFSFGLFSSHIPYIIVTAVYLLYYVFCAFNTADAAVEASVPDTGKNLAVSALRLSDERTVACPEVLVFDQADAVKTCIPEIKPLRLLTRVVYLPDKTLITKYTRNSLLPRSPPLN